MIVTYLRSSSYNNWRFCEMQYFITYVLGYRADSGKAAEAGTTIHKIMEILAFLKKFQQDNPKRKFLEVDDDVAGKVKVKVADFESEEFIEGLIDKCYTEYTSRSKHHWTKADRKTASRWTWLGLDYNNRQFDPRIRNIVEPEPHFDIMIDEPWAKFEYDADGETISGNLAIKGTIDLVTKVSDNTIEVIDYKTGQRKNWNDNPPTVKTYEDYKTDAQLLLYYYAISHLFPEYEHTIMTVFWVRDGGPFSMCYDKSDRDMFLGMLKDRFEEIKNNSNPKPLSVDRRGFKCEKLCHFCKNKWEGSDKNMCQYIGDHLDKHGMDKTIVELSKPGHSVGYYQAPG